MKTYAVCHKNCHDGLASAWVAKFANPEIEVFFSSPKHEWKDQVNIRANDHVYFIDMCPDPADLVDLINKGVLCNVLDHHDTNVRKIANFDEKNQSSLHQYCTFDMSIAGCVIAWKHFFPSQPLPKLIEYIGISDTWQWRGDEDYAVIQYVRTLLEPDAKVEEFHDLAQNFDENTAIALGGTVYKRIAKEADYTSKHGHLMDFDGVVVAAANASSFHSEIGHRLSLISPSKIGVVYTFHPVHDGVKLSFRGPEANKLAEKYGGGGHPEAAGCYMSIDQFYKYLKTAKKNV